MFSMIDIHFRKPFILTLLTEGVVLLAGLATLQLAAQSFGTSGFGEYAVSRRAISLLAFPLLMGLGISLPRAIALATTKDHTRTQWAGLFFASLAIAVPVLGALALAGLTMADPLAPLAFGDRSFANMVLPIVLATTGLYLHTIMYAFYRGQLRMSRANFLQIVNIGVIPFAAVGLLGTDPAAAIAFTGLGWTLISIAVGVQIAISLSLRGLTRSLLVRSAHDLISFGVPRIPAEIGLFGIFAVPTFIVASKLGIEQAGFFSLGLSLMQFASSLFATPGILLLPHISRLAGEKAWTLIRSVVARVLLVSIVLITLIVGIVEFALPVIINAFMGEAFAGAVSGARWIMVGSIPYVAYMILRSPLDAIARFPHNSVNLALALVVSCGLILLGGSWVSPSASILISMTVLGLFTMSSWMRSLDRMSAL